MNKTEWDKCKMGERFNVDIITSTGKEPTTKDLLKIIIIRLDSVETRLTRLESDVTGLKVDMANVKAYLKKQDVLNATFVDYMRKHP
ncbi:MAG: hypothetical protein LBV37_01340 [Mycoplasmataceae bacterium]|nr:hypothetical protein [Mycoplasmataceae bacterium]